jgi:PIN domain nuclease of toxin-antitoxin system
MKLLLDTHVLVWAAHSPQRLSKHARTMLSDSANELVFSAASIWELTIKYGLNPTQFQAHPRVLRRGLIENDYVELPVTGEHALAVSSLPALHKDPFDRLLIAQATVEGILLLTSDAEVARYPGPIRKI